MVTLERVRGLPCLVLLGEPGSGKSYALQQEADAARHDAPPHDVVLMVDLGLAQDARELALRVFDNPAVERWRASTFGRLHLFLDSLDEAKIQIRKVVSLLEQHLATLDAERLVLRITCRTAERPTELESWLSAFFGQERFRTLELAPLRLSEAKDAVAAAGVDAEAFIDSVIKAGVAPLAARPLTLRMLQRVFASEGGFPEALAPLYQRAMLLMAGEVDSERRDLRVLTETGAVAVAARIAAAPSYPGAI